MILPSLTVAPSGHKGRGVFTTKKLQAGTIVEISPVIALSKKDRKMVEQTKLTNYIFEWGDDHKQACLALGYVSLYNHEYNSNCEYEMDFENLLITIRTVKPVKKGEELSINYNATPGDETPVWFDTKAKSKAKNKT